MALNFYFEDYFDKPGFSRGILISYSRDHISKLTLTAPTLYAQEIIDTTSKLKAFEDDIVDEETSEGVQETSTGGRILALGNVLKFIKTKAKSLVEILENTPGAYNEFYPQLLKEYNNAKKADWEILLPRYLGVAKKYESVVGKDFVATFTTLSTAYITAAEVQNNKGNTKKNNNKDVRGTRKALTLQLTHNIITIAKNNIGNSEALARYADESLLKRKKKPSKGKNPPKNPPKSI